MFPEGNVPGYVCNPGSPRERDAASQGHTSGIPTRALLHSWKLAPAAHHVLLSILVVTSPAPDVWLSILTDYTYDSELDIADGVPLAFSTQRLVPSGNQGYIRNLGRSVCPVFALLWIIKDYLHLSILLHVCLSHCSVTSIYSNIKQLF